MTRALLLIPVAVGAFALAGCGIADDGERTTQTRDLGTFTRVDNRSSVDVHLRVGEPQKVTVRAGDKVIGDVRTSVHDGTLKIVYDHHGWFGDRVVVDATVPELTAIDTSGSGDVDVGGVDTDAFAVRADGSADVDVRGATHTLTVDVDGSGDADLSDLDARSAKVAVGGSGDAHVKAADRLDARVEGSGDLRYAGDPAVTKHVDGSGDISRD